MNRVMLAGLRGTLSRLLATGLSVVLAVGFVVATLTLSATFSATTEQTLTANMANADVRVTPTVAMAAGANPREFLDPLLPAILDVPHVAGANVERTAYLDLRFNGTRSVAKASGLLTEKVRWQTLASGAWPQANTEATLDQVSAKSLGVRIGDTVAISAVNAGVSPAEITIVGVTASSAEGAGLGVPTLALMPDVLLNPSYFAVATGILVSGDGIDADALAASVSDAVADTPGVVAQSGQEAVDYQTGQLSGSASVVRSILLAFAVIVVFVAGMVIANTFQVLVSQRTKDLALLRCIGASTAQVRRLILAEAAVLGTLASIVGVAAGIGAAQLLAMLSRTSSSALHLGQITVEPPLVAIGFGIGVVLTVLSALPPAQQATRVRPIAALRATDARIGTRQGTLRGAIAVLLMAVGSAGLYFGATRFGLAVAVPAAIVSFLGVLLGAALVIPWLVRGAGSTIAWTSVPARLAALNATRNPRRTAATAAALLVGVTLVTMMVVGVESVRTSVTDRIDEKRPVDLTAQSVEGAGMTPEQTNSIAALDGVEYTTLVTAGKVQIESDASPALTLAARGVDPAGAQAVARSTVATPAANEVLLNPTDAAGIRSGDSLTVTGVNVMGVNATATLVAKVSDDAPSQRATFTQAGLQSVVTQPVTRQIQVRLGENFTGDQVQQISTEILSLGDDLRVGGGAPERTYFEQVLDVMLIIVLALLALAVVIAVVGVGNTMALSVIERRRESGLLRALGLTRGQLRGMLGTEAALITGVAAVCGIGLGVFYAWAGLSAVALDANKLSLTTHVPWAKLGLVVAGAFLAGIAASIVPAVGAARKSPIEGLTHR